MRYLNYFTNGRITPSQLELAINTKVTLTINDEEHAKTPKEVTSQLKKTDVIKVIEVFIHNNTIAA